MASSTKSRTSTPLSGPQPVEQLSLVPSTPPLDTGFAEKLGVMFQSLGNIQTHEQLQRNLKVILDKIPPEEIKEIQVHFSEVTGIIENSLHLTDGKRAEIPTGKWREIAYHICVELLIASIRDRLKLVRFKPRIPPYRNIDIYHSRADKLEVLLKSDKAHMDWNIPSKILALFDQLPPDHRDLAWKERAKIWDLLHTFFIKIKNGHAANWAHQEHRSLIVEITRALLPEEPEENE